ncbi:AraC family transcriptional regulator [Bifidobacterium goeldii]|uniref:AraC family transcriptional regulator n=1 Tax=Bifidobacterium goeldii TaxID=2306975 RepID=A0A430FMI7_9BIFI|nr:helix-turn-helix domain-containing protein [Bifidobacterium goeldii]RSX54037.1 AraC family transcriptional regulator [Bifidobacterium goeldii]
MATLHKKVTVFSDLSEHIYYNVPGLPIYAHCDPLSSFPDYRCPCHWHRDLEFIHVVSGELHYFVNGHTDVLQPGEGIVVNSSRLHYDFSPDKRESWFSCAVISPTLFEHVTTDVAARCERAFAQHMEDFLHLSPDIDWQRDVLMGVERVIRLMPGGGMRGSQRNADTQQTHNAGNNPLPALAAAIELCDMVLDRFEPNTTSTLGDDMATEQSNRMTVLEMTGIIQSRFRDPLGLDDIAAAGGVSRSQCCILFKKYVGRTPNECLTERRLEEARRLLANTNLSIAEIARECGFSSASYFINVFRKRAGATPGEYREAQYAARA